MNRTRTQVLIDEVAMWSSLAIYLLMWAAALSLGFESRLLVPALAVSSLYVGMHVYEMTARHHCYLCADSTAAPVTLVATILGSVMFHFAFGTTWAEIGWFVVRGFMVSMPAHIAALLYAALLTTGAQWCLRSRIDVEYVQQLEENRLRERRYGY